MSEALGVGSKVRLKSGGPIMTIDAINDRGRAVCLFFINGAPNLQSETFSLTSLEPAEEATWGARVETI